MGIKIKKIQYRFFQSYRRASHASITTSLVKRVILRKKRFTNPDITPAVNKNIKVKTDVKMDLETLMSALELSLSNRDKTDTILTVSLRDNNKGVREVNNDCIQQGHLM